MVSPRKKFNALVCFIPFTLLLFSCNESEFYEKEYLDGVGVKKDNEINFDDFDFQNNPFPAVTTNGPSSTPGSSIILKDMKDTFTQKTSAEGQVDILWVVDDSGSMRDEQKALAYNFDIFIHEFIEKKVDFTMAITTTDATSKYNGRVVGNPLLLTRSAALKNESKFYNDFARFINVGTKGSGREKGIHTSVSFLKRYGLNFFRKDAFAIIVYVSDEEDQSPYKVGQYIGQYTSFKENPGMVKIYSIVTQNKTQRWESTGDRYIAASDFTGGTSASIKGNFHTILKNMGNQIVNLVDSFALASIPYQDKIVVDIDGKLALASSYDYDSVSRTIKFKNGFLPGEGAKITVNYQVQEQNSNILLGSN